MGTIFFGGNKKEKEEESKLTIESLGT